MRLRFFTEYRSRKLLFSQQRYVRWSGGQRLFGADYLKNVPLYLTVSLYFAVFPLAAEVWRTILKVLENAVTGFLLTYFGIGP